jgi:hypothetical protein
MCTLNQVEASKRIYALKFFDLRVKQKGCVCGSGEVEKIGEMVILILKNRKGTKPEK